MDHKFTKKPVTIEAFQMTLARRTDNRDWPEWLHRAWNGHPGEPGTMQRTAPDDAEPTDELAIITLEGVHRVTFGDWIIRGINGELYPCKPDIFEKTYTHGTGPAMGHECGLSEDAGEGVWGQTGS